jgi:hypothetical protein
MSALTLRILPGRLGVARLDAAAPVPEWAGGDAFASVTRTADELSIICDEALIPASVRCERGWCALMLEGQFEFSQIGVLSPIAQALARAEVSLLTVSTFDTDIILVKHSRLDRARAALVSAGYRVIETA